MALEKGTQLQKRLKGASIADLNLRVSAEPLRPYSEGTKKRLLKLKMSKKLTELQRNLLEVAIRYSSRGAGASAPASLDIYSISAPVDKVSACRNPAWIEVRCHHGNKTHVVVRCRRCEGCWHAWRSKVRHIISKGCFAEKVYFLTLTIKEYPDKMKEDRFDLIQRRWHDLLRSAGRIRFTFEYLRVVELQKRGTPHFHIAVKDVRRNKGRLPSTKVISRTFRRLAKASGFGYIEGKTFSFEAARLGGKGVASYLSKYIGKADGYKELVRTDGRAIRRYARSRKWSNHKAPSVYRYARTSSRISRKVKSTEPLRCSCGQGEILEVENQVKKWLVAVDREGSWVAPVSVGDYIMEKERKEVNGISKGKTHRSKVVSGGRCNSVDHSASISRRKAKGCQDVGVLCVGS